VGTTGYGAENQTGELKLEGPVSTSGFAVVIGAAQSGLNHLAASFRSRVALISESNSSPSPSRTAAR
jgi:hypothetical protein